MSNIFQEQGIMQDPRLLMLVFETAGRADIEQFFPRANLAASRLAQLQPWWVIIEAHRR